MKKLILAVILAVSINAYSNELNFPTELKYEHEKINKKRKKFFYVLTAAGTIHSGFMVWYYFGKTNTDPNRKREGSAGTAFWVGSMITCFQLNCWISTKVKFEASHQAIGFRYTFK